MTAMEQDHEQQQQHEQQLEQQLEQLQQHEQQQPLLPVPEALAAMQAAVRAGELQRAALIGARAAVPLSVGEPGLSVLGELAAGAEATVLSGSLGSRDVAIKRFRITSTDDLKRFRRELTHLAALRGHPHIVPLVAARALPPDYLLVTPLAACSMHARLYQQGWRPQSAAELLSLAVAAADALVAVHARGLVHRDFKPSNLLLSFDGELWLADFGLAATLDEATREATLSVGLVRARGKPTGGFLRRAAQGTLEYMAPEVLHKRPATHASDVYALAVTINELATGTRPFSDCTKENPDVHTVLEHGYGRQELAVAVSAEGLRPTLPRPGVEAPEGLAELLQAAWATEQGLRPTARQLRDALAALLQRALAAQRAADVAGALGGMRLDEAAVALACGGGDGGGGASSSGGGSFAAPAPAMMAAAAASMRPGLLPGAPPQLLPLVPRGGSLSGLCAPPSGCASVLSDAPDSDAQFSESVFSLPFLHQQQQHHQQQQRTRPRACPSSLSNASTTHTSSGGSSSNGGGGSGFAGGLGGGPGTLSSEAASAAAAAAAAAAVPTALSLQGALSQAAAASTSTTTAAAAGTAAAAQAADAEFGRVAVGAFAALGPREAMEDRHVVVQGLGGDARVTLAAVFDGHRGSEAAAYAAQHLPRNLLLASVEAAQQQQQLQQQQQQPPLGHEPALDAASAPAAALARAFLATDAAFYQHWQAEAMARAGAAGGGGGAARSPGATAIAVVVAGRRLYVANAGDSRAVLSRGGRPVALSQQHTADLPDERARVVAAGGAVALRGGSWRVGAAALQVTRALGDFDLKQPVRQQQQQLSSQQQQQQHPQLQQQQPSRSPYAPHAVAADGGGGGAAGATQQQPQQQWRLGPWPVTAEPEVVALDLNPATDQFVVVGSDGLWDALRDDEALGLVRDTVKEPSLAAKRLVQEALARGSRDNVTALVAFLRPAHSLERVWRAGAGSEVPAATATFYGSRRPMAAPAQEHQHHQQEDGQQQQQPQQHPHSYAADEAMETY